MHKCRTPTPNCRFSMGILLTGSIRAAESCVRPNGAQKMRKWSSRPCCGPSMWKSFFWFYRPSGGSGRRNQYMSLMRLLAAGTSLVGIKDRRSPYKLTQQNLLPKFGSGKEGEEKAAAPVQSLVAVAAPGTASESGARIEPIAKDQKRKMNLLVRAWDRLHGIRTDPHPGPLPSDGRGGNFASLV